MKNSEIFVLNAIAQTIYDKKGMNILALDVRGLSTITDYVIIAEGNVDKHVGAIAQAIQENLKKIGETVIRVEGMPEGDWVVLDYFHIMVHLFAPGMRDKYCLEELWQKGEIVDLNIELSPIKSDTYVGSRWR